LFDASKDNGLENKAEETRQKEVFKEVVAVF
jgi:hypothetical protein